MAKKKSYQNLSKEKLLAEIERLKKEFLENNTVSIYEFFYWYRIKSNYRDLEFLDKDIDDRQFRDFYKNYFELTVSFYEALKKF